MSELHKVIIFRQGDEQLEAIPMVNVDEWGNGRLTHMSIDGFKRHEAFEDFHPLGASKSFFSPSLDVMTYRELTGVVFANQAGTLYVEHSADGYDWIRTQTGLAVSASSGKEFSYKTSARYIRVVFTNGVTANTVFKIMGYLN
ncbi:hypothetical protein CN367_11725 [Priestia megaterium]|uniref:hypothetical protein n=1 Tax=Priestia megaterium TaxID=1404 RepID=UPI000BF8ADD3|nr:hypothetical protein [Priestia megaterium]PEZ47030.1 hypothetical protein CN367_11725 [Priestia megaterium]